LRVGTSGAKSAVGRPASWTDESWWRAEIDAAIDRRDPVLSNVRITLAHRQLSLALHEVTGPGSGANFHTWAVWGSKKAGRTIRQEDVPWLPRVATAVGAGASTAWARRRPRTRMLAAAVTAGAALNALTHHVLSRTATQIFGGNVTVLDDIGRQTARFVSTFLDPADRTDDRLEQFLAPLCTGPAEKGGQGLLRTAYRHYLEVARTPPSDERDERMLTANLLAILHEHHRLDPYIDAAMPRLLRPLVTRYLLTFSLGTEVMRVSRDVTARSPTAFPETLRTIELPELAQLLDGPGGLDRTPDSLHGSGARDWTELADRMNFIVDLFRTRQFDENLFARPFSLPEWDALVQAHPDVRSCGR
jgi:hypothetical protein